MRLYKVIAYAWKTWLTTLEDEKELAILEKKFVRRICGPKMNNLIQ